MNEEGRQAPVSLRRALALICKETGKSAVVWLACSGKLNTLLKWHLTITNKLPMHRLAQPSANLLVGRRKCNSC